MKKLHFSLGLLVLIFALSSMKISAVNIVPFGEITGKKTEPTTTETTATETIATESIATESTTIEPEITETLPNGEDESGTKKRRDGVKIVPFGEITGKKTEPTTTEPDTDTGIGTGTSETLPDEEDNGQKANRGSGVKVVINPPLFSRGRVETLFPVSYKVPEQWLGEFAYDSYDDPSMFYYPELDNFDKAVQVLAYSVNREGRTDEEFLRYIMDTIKDEDNYITLQYKLVRGPDFPYARLTIERDYRDSVAFLDRFYRIVEDQVVLFQSFAFDAPDAGHVAYAEAMFLSQYIDDAKPQVPARWKSVTHEKAVFRYPETWNFTPMDYEDDTINGFAYMAEDGLTFLTINEEYDTSFFETDTDYFDDLESYAKWIAGRYDEYEIVGVDIYLDKEYTMRMRFFGTAQGENFEVQVFALLDTVENRLYTLTLETYADPEGPNWEMIELFDTIVETFEVVNDPAVGQA